MCVCVCALLDHVVDTFHSTTSCNNRISRFQKAIKPKCFIAFEWFSFWFRVILARSRAHGITSSDLNGQHFVLKINCCSFCKKRKVKKNKIKEKSLRRNHRYPWPVIHKPIWCIALDKNDKRHPLSRFKMARLLSIPPFYL